jgi:energy-coupling factor transport system permease protein
MMKFQTVDRDSFFTRLDFRPKLVMVVVITLIAFVWESPLTNGIMAFLVVLGCILAGVKLEYLKLMIKVLIPFYILLLITHGFFNDFQVMSLTGKETLTPIFTLPENWWIIGGLAMTVEGTLYGLNVIFKTMAMALVIPLAVFTTEVNNVIVGMVRAKVPYKIAFIFSSTLRFFPLLFEEIGAIIEAQRLRGLAMEKMGPIKRIRVYARVTIPLILGAMFKSQQLEVVLQSKAFSGSPNRTYLHESILGVADYAIIGLFLLLFVLAMVAYFGFGVGRFGWLLYT